MGTSQWKSHLWTRLEMLRGRSSPEIGAKSVHRERLGRASDSRVNKNRLPVVQAPGRATRGRVRSPGAPGHRGHPGQGWQSTTVNGASEESTASQFDPISISAPLPIPSSNFIDPWAWIAIQGYYPSIIYSDGTSESDIISDPLHPQHRLGPGNLCPLLPFRVLDTILHALDLIWVTASLPHSDLATDLVHC